MSVPVELEALADKVEEFGAGAYAVTADAQATCHVVSVRAVWQGDELVIGAGRHTSDNVTATGGVTLLWPAPLGEPYSLIVDGEGRVETDGATIVVRPTRAVLHRVAGADAALDSCVKLLET
jgi:hypothetical protein